MAGRPLAGRPAVSAHTSGEGNVLPKKGHGSKIFGFDALVQVTLLDSYQEFWGMARKIRHFLPFPGRHGNKFFFPT